MSDLINIKMKPTTQILNNNIDVLLKYFPLKGADFCSDILNISAKEIRIFCNYKKIKRMKGYKGQSKTGVIYNNKFINEIDEFSSYILGFLWADGYVSKKSNHITLEIKKEDALEIQDIIMKTGEWRISERQRYRNDILFGKIQLCYSAISQDVVKILLENSFDKKSEISPSQILSIIPSHLIHYFWRGFFDGDGNLYTATKYEFSFWGSYNQSWKDLEELLSGLEIKYSIRRKINSRNQSYSQIYCCNLIGVNKFIDYISQGVSFGISRKRLTTKLYDKRQQT